MSTQKSELDGDDQQGSSNPMGSQRNLNYLLHELNEAQLTEKQAVWIRRRLFKDLVGLRQRNKSLKELGKQSTKKVLLIRNKIELVKSLIGER